MTRHCAAVLAIAAVGVAGCGSSSSSSSISPATYRATVNKICATDNAKITALPSDTASSISGLDKILALATNSVAQVKAVTPPSSISARVHTWLGVVTQSASNATAILSADKAGHKSQVQSLAAKGQTLDSQGNADAKSLGLPSCAADAQPSGS